MLQFHGVVLLIFDNYMFVAPIEAEILRLEKRREVLQHEITDTDEMIVKQRQLLKDTRMGIKIQLDNNHEHEKRIAEKNEIAVDDVAKNSLETPEKSIVESDTGVDNLEDSIVEYDEEGDSQNYDDLYDEECEMVDIIRQLEPDLLFVLHRGNTDDIILYVPPYHRMNTSNDKNKDIIFLYRLQVYNDMDSAEVVSSFESQMGFGPKMIDNSKRNDPSVLQLPYRSALDDYQDLVAEFAYAIELPVLPNIVIDIWKIPRQKLSQSQHNQEKTKDIYFATTTIQGHSFVNLERIFLMVETRWGMPTIVGIELSGRQSKGSKLLVEVIAQS